MDFYLAQRQQTISFASAIARMSDAGVLQSSTLPTYLWSEQDAKYQQYWEWWNNKPVLELAGKTKDGEEVLRFPLRIGMRNIFRKHVSFLFGEAPENTDPLIQNNVAPKDLLEDDVDAQDLARFSEAVFNEVWRESSGRSIQMEAGLISQFTGGSVFQVKYYPDLVGKTLIPIRITRLLPDWFYPVWSNENPNELLEAFIAYRIQGATAERMYGVKSNGPWAIYIEHWTPEKYSIFVENEPVKANGIVYKDRKNPFGIVPIVYIPHLREGQFYGTSHVPDIEGLILEYNARLADQGRAIKRFINRERYLTNVAKQPQRIGLTGDDPNAWTAIDLGRSAPGTDAPSVEMEDPPEFPPAFIQFVDRVWVQILRESHMNTVAYGEDEGSQRSALTLAFRMWPSTSHARVERTHWSEGVRLLWNIVMTMMAVKKIQIGKRSIPLDYNNKLMIVPGWYPQIPRDRESLLNEAVLRKQAHILSRSTAVAMFDDVVDIDEELKLIEADMEFEAEVGSGFGDEGAPAETEDPVATSGLEGGE